ncbi:MAG: thiamine biosynthesis protein ThiS [Omnitrophica bacterium RIFCSPLOWO2_12_FULL_44_17]|uniref:Thiamine biosynthesis protein ThiS n=1 Tax=Candidatus Danuiimicrobium aquiferis TaxID=1801832 RepID=A0A1G1KZH4_9BACT|nr:MAG: thiamine biosynthesis protein ThiS [Omnitrophica bacterium RIFCSPHIGHO2_02_FULL_45_28]OGW89128.1 MAG: thiamine biosynthesis protein ThiS [Omnitrophica bacterium RIFCSPHIGHO2_12_FULL_44_12]OGW98283.1 MAG: thiamine biosynthesis protein ThiS [Omnitrophica bacterium RIFCSPLOWO2_12_FULL_44_17]OGX02877.1 MAG: thiamine biosynthesis protein ThiS [Omnitrophica bacterium RIFCSPLOWO2_02_FULL_44_11]
MVIKINGKNENVEEALNLWELAINKKLSPERIVIERNLRIVPKEEWKEVVLEENDQIEIISFVGGG